MFHTTTCQSTNFISCKYKYSHKEHMFCYNLNKLNFINNGKLKPFCGWTSLSSYVNKHHWCLNPNEHRKTLYLRLTVLTPCSSLQKLNWYHASTILLYFISQYLTWLNGILWIKIFYHNAQFYDFHSRLERIYLKVW